ncbi:MAG: GNAT family N-acetyltransferase [Rhodopirellula sp.]|nr:GNAT family N-acetyltransferase [Rhodopirellula sp.]
MDLERVRRSGNLLALLRSNSRQQLRHALKRVGEEYGQLAVRAAGDLHHALEIFEELAALHSTTWAARGESGAFAAPQRLQFHRDWIAERFAHGEMQLLRVTAGQRTLACMMNVVYRGRVYSYQTGIQYGPLAALKPGYLAHLQAIEYNADLGHQSYDFLAGDSRYKRNLSTDANRLIWARIQKPRLKFYLENHLRAVVRRWRKRRQVR